MEYWVAMNRKELQISLLLLKMMDLPGVLALDPDFFPQQSDLEKMLEKRFFEAKGDRKTWNPFVKTVLWSAANAQSELRIKGAGQMQCHLYFHNDDMVLMTREFDPELYIFYYVPLLPKAIGGLAKCLEALEAMMQPDAAGEPQSIFLPLDGTSGAESVAVLSARTIPGQLRSEYLPLTVDGWCFGEHSLENVLIRTQNGFGIAARDHDRLLWNPVGFYDFIQHISRWIVRAHGQSIAAKERTNGTDQDMRQQDSPQG